MKLIDKVYEQMCNEKIIKKIIMQNQYPNDFGFKDNLESCKKNDERSCLYCWNREVDQ